MTTAAKSPAPVHSLVWRPALIGRNRWLAKIAPVGHAMEISLDMYGVWWRTCEPWLPFGRVECAPYADVSAVQVAAVEQLKTKIEAEAAWLFDILESLDAKPEPSPAPCGSGK